MNEKRRPPNLRPGPLPAREPNPNPDWCTVIFHFDEGGPADASFPRSALPGIHESLGIAWNSPGGQMFTVADEDGNPHLMVNLGKVRAVEVR